MRDIEIIDNIESLDDAKQYMSKYGTVKDMIDLPEIGKKETIDIPNQLWHQDGLQTESQPNYQALWCKYAEDKCPTTQYISSRISDELGKKYEGQIEVEERIVDNCAMQLVLNPDQFDVLITTNMFGDILSDEIAGLVGGLGLAPSANIGKDASIFEAVHGSAPDISGQGIANPIAEIASFAMALRYSFNLTEEAQLIEDSISSSSM